MIKHTDKKDLVNLSSHKSSADEKQKISGDKATGAGQLLSSQLSASLATKLTEVKPKRVTLAEKLALSTKIDVKQVATNQ